MLLYFIRHGQTVYNADERIQGQLDSELSPLGRRQHAALVAALRGRPIEAVYSSPLQRALNGATLLAGALGLEVKIDERLMEINAGIFQGHSWTEIARRFPEPWEKWRSYDPDYRIPNGESRRDVSLRAAAVLADIHAAGHSQAAIVSHGGLVAAALKAAIAVPLERNPFQLLNASISRLSWDGQYRLLSLNEVSHLDGTSSEGGEL
jgi:broad specificity phosphatase PhoE